MGEPPFKKVAFPDNTPIFMGTKILENNNEFSAHFMVLSEKHRLHALFKDDEDLDKSKYHEKQENFLDDILMRYNINKNAGKKGIGSELAYVCQKNKRMSDEPSSSAPQPPMGPPLTAFVPGSLISLQEFDFIIYRGPIGHIWQNNYPQKMFSIWR